MTAKTNNEMVSYAQLKHTEDLQQTNALLLEEGAKVQVDSVEAVELERSVGLLGGVALLIGSIIGSGIFASPKYVALHGGSAAGILFIWCGCGLFALFCGLCMIELGTTFPNFAGAGYCYLKVTFGGLVAFPIAIILGFVVFPIANAMVLLTCGNYLLEAFNVYDQRYSKLIAAVLTLVLLLVNIQGVGFMKHLQVVFTAAKLVAVVMISVTGIVRICQGHYENLANAFKGKSPSVADTALGFYAGMWAYGGWDNLNFAVLEMKDPKRHLPRAMWISIPCVCLCYVLVNIGYLTLMTPHEIAQSSATAVVFSKRLYGVMSWSIPLLVGCSTFGSANAGMYVSSRLIFSLALDGYLPRMFALVNRRRHTPILAILIFAFFSVVVLIPKTSSFSTLLNYLSFLAWCNHALSISTILINRKTKPHLNRPYKVFLGVPVVALLCSLYLVIAPIISKPWNALYGCIMLVLPLFGYVPFVRYEMCPTLITHFIGALTVKLGKLLDSDVALKKEVTEANATEDRLVEN